MSKRDGQVGKAFINKGKRLKLPKSEIFGQQHGYESVSRPKIRHMSVNSVHSVSFKEIHLVCHYISFSTFAIVVSF